jgi:CubicO group peptidase (beta-lactamase class C family)
VSGVPYVDHVRTAILEPLGMTNTHFEPLPDEARRRRATGYNARWLSFQFREDGGPREGAQVLSGSTLKEMHTARYLGNEDWTQAWGIAWYSVRKDGVT